MCNVGIIHFGDHGAMTCSASTPNRRDQCCRRAPHLLAGHRIRRRGLCRSRGVGTAALPPGPGARCARNLTGGRTDTPAPAPHVRRAGPRRRRRRTRGHAGLSAVPRFVRPARRRGGLRCSHGPFDGRGVRRHHARALPAHRSGLLTANSAPEVATLCQRPRQPCCTRRASSIICTPRPHLDPTAR